MKTKILFIERQPSLAVSIEKVFREVAGKLSKQKFIYEFQHLNFANDLQGTLKNLIFFRKKTADIYHVTGHAHYIALVLPKNKTVLTIHDVGILYIRQGFRRFVLKKLLFDLPIKRLRYITVVSETTKRELIKLTDCDERKIRVIENPLQEHFRTSQKKTFSKNQPTILQIGTAVNKNLPKLIAALEGIKCRLIIIGELSPELLDLLEQKKIIYVNKIRLNNEQIRNEYAEADIVTFCSTFEGFGLPIIEAQAMLTPVITSNISPLREVAGDGAALAEPENADSIRNCILKVINDERYRNTLVLNGFRNIEKYQPSKIIPLYESLYLEMLRELR